MKKKTGNIFWGVILISAALLWLLSDMGYLGGIGFKHIAFSVIWGAWLIKGLVNRESFSIFMPLAFLAIVWDKTLGIEAITPWPVIGAAVLLSTGCSMIFRGKKRRNWEGKYWRNNDMNGTENYVNKNDEDKTWEKNTNYGTDQPHQSHTDGEHVYHMNRYSGAQKYIDSQNLKSVEIINKCGGMEVYLDKANAAEDVVQMRIECIAGGMDIYIPRSWKLVNQVKCFAGSLQEPEEQYMYEAVNDVTLVLTGEIKAGAVEITRL